MAQFWDFVGLHCFQCRGGFGSVLAREDAEGEKKREGLRGRLQIIRRVQFCDLAIILCPEIFFCYQSSLLAGGNGIFLSI